MKITVEVAGGVLQWQELEGFHDGKYEVDIKNLDIRSIQQNKAIHLYCEKISKELNNRNLSVVNVLKPDVEWTMLNVKELIWKPILKAMKHKDSTTKMEKTEITDVYEVINKLMGEKFGIFVPFPSIENKGRKDD